MLLIWGSASQLTAQDQEVQAGLKTAIQNGVRAIACRKCAENLGVDESLKDLGVEVFYTGEFLTEWLQSAKPFMSV